MIRGRIGVDLVEALVFHVYLSKEVWRALEARFQENDVIGCFIILNPCKLSCRQVGMKSWGVTDLEKLYNNLKKENLIGEDKYAIMIDVDVVMGEFNTYNIQAST